MNIFEYINNSVDYTEYVKRFSDFTCFIGTIVTFLFSIFYSYYINKNIQKMIQKEYPKEELVYTFRPQILWSVASALSIGAFGGGLIVPFFLFDNIENIRIVTQGNLIYYCFLILFFISFFVCATSYATAVTNKRILFKNKYKNPFFTDLNIEITNIQYIDLISSNNQIEIKTKDGKNHVLGSYRDSKKCYEKLKRLMEENKEE